MKAPVLFSITAILCLPGSAEVPFSQQPRWSSVQELNSVAIRTFIQSEKLGLSRIPDVQPKDPRLFTTSGRWFRIKKIELVGLLKNQEPIVYMFENGIPAKELLKESKGRKLDSFEA